ncbi:MAG: alpha/beta hydrolase, partial [Planctomycetes bacterium]|nr:alpha/beta hydrolase [Planctomycetota bacterium]
ADFSAALIHGFARERFHILENLELFFPDRREDGEGLYLFEPYDPERIPVLLIHGIWSSPITFLELHNEIIGDPQLNTRFQVWSYLYPTGLSVWENAARLRRRLKALRHTLDPSGRDPAMRDMVVVGHSMGGLLARTLAQDSGDKVGSAFFNRPTSELGLPEELAQRLDEIFHFSPLDYLSRIIFVATPHRGSGYASSILGSLVSKLVDSPDFLQRELDWLIERRPEWVACRSSRLAELGDSVLDLEYDSVTIRVFQSLTWDPRIAIHTILGTTIADQIVPDTTDGIVDYSSGHLDQAISERIVPTGHAVHKHPLAIQEIRRILRKHATP